MNTPVEVIVVNFNAGEAVVHCIESVLAQSEPVAVTVIDNASTDGSVEAVSRLCEGRDDVRLVRNDGNPGFAPAVNQAVGSEPRNYLLILNPDCEMEPGSLSALCNALDGDPLAGLAGPMVTDAQGRPARAMLRRFPSPWNSFLSFSGLWRLGQRSPAFQGVEIRVPESAGVTVAEAVSGACMLVRKQTFLDLGGMDEAYRLHCEDLDLMYRLRQNGHRCLFVPGARVVHRQGLSSSSRPAWVHWQKHRGMQRFFQKFQAPRYAFPVRWLVLAGIWLRFLATAPLLLFRR
jgi:GT2 family glycosyltransferase